MNYLEEKPRVDPVDRVKNMVRHSLVASPTVTNKELFDRALEIAPAVVEGMSLKQFHAKFRLPITRFEMGSRPRSERKPRSAARNNGIAASSSDASATIGEAKSAPRKRSRSRRLKTNGFASPANSATRGLIRTAIIDFVVELERAEQRSDLIQVVSRVDTVVDRILQITTDGTAAAAPMEAATA